MNLTTPQIAINTDLIPWTSWTPTYSDDLGSLSCTTVYAEYLKLGKIVFIQIAFDINATGGGNVRFTLPSGLAPANATCGNGREYKVTGAALSTLFIVAGQGLILSYPPNTISVSGYGAIVNGFYEVA